ncbi:MAG TPA: TonB-dependent receptor [Rhodanobacteraceae bacterium]|nr:TonB-dependent receptor [Rhodanobacteraceae bacterium]
MNIHKSVLAASISGALLLVAATAPALAATPAGGPAAQPQNTTSGQSAQQAQSTSSQSQPQQLQAVQVVGIRASLLKSLETQRASNATVSVVTAEDIGKFPNTNVAEAMTLVPGVAVDRRYGQGGRVSINGTDPSLNLTFLDDYPIPTVDWLFGEEPDTGFDYTILAPEILGNLEIYKTAEARLPSGSLGGTVIMHTRKPLDLPANTLTASVGEVYNDQAHQGKPNGSVFYSWKNASSTVGFDIALSRYEEAINRQGHEVFSFEPVSAYMGNPLVAREVSQGLIKPTDQVSSEQNAALMTQPRKRNTAVFNLQVKPNDHLSFLLGGLYIHENFTGFNQSMYAFNATTPNNVTSFTSNNNGLITSGHVCGLGETMTLPDGTSQACGGAVTFLDDYLRGSTVNTKALHLNVDYEGNHWGVSGLVGISTAYNRQNVYFLENGYQGGYTFNTATGATYDDPAAVRDPANWGEIGGFQGAYIYQRFYDKDAFAHLDFHVDFDSIFNRLQFGVRVVNAKEQAFDNEWDNVAAATYAQLGGVSYTNILNNSSFPNFSKDMGQHVQIPQSAVENWVIRTADTSPSQLSPSSPIDGNSNFAQLTEAAYVQQDFDTGNGLRGNFGVRFVRNRIASTAFNTGGLTPVWPAPASWWQTAHANFDDVLPSFNIAYDTGDNVVLRLAGAKVIAWAPVSQRLNTVGLNPTPLTGTAGNPDLPPYKSYNYSASVEWYFAPQAVLSFTSFLDHILNYNSTVTTLEPVFNPLIQSNPQLWASTYLNQLGNCNAQGICDFAITHPESIGAGQIRGLSVAYQQAFGDTGFGLVTNWTYAQGSTNAGEAIPYSSKNSITVSPYYEKGPFNARVDVNWRSRYLAGGYIAGAAPATVNNYTELDFSAGWAFNRHYSLDFAALNMLNEAYDMYQGSPDVPLNKYTNGRRYMLTFHYKL